MKKGQSLIELLLVIGLLAILLPALLTGLVTSREGRPQQKQRIQATTVLNEAEEAVRSVKEAGWQNIAQLTTGIAYHPVAGISWSLLPNAVTVNGFTRQVVFSNVMRNSTGNIDPAGTILDPSTKKVDITVSWTQPYNSSNQSSFYLTRFRDNLTFTQTTKADFDPGIKDNTFVTNTGEVTLNNVSNADWCKPQEFVVNKLTLPKLSNSIYALQGGAYLGSGDGSSGTPAFINVGINTPAPPNSPSASILGTFNGTFTTNSIFKDGNYVYLATNSNPQVIILDVSNPNNPSQVGTVTIPGGQPANSVYLAGNILFATSGNTLYTFNLTTKTGPHTSVKSSRDMYAGIWSQPTARQVFVANGRAYVGTGNSLLGLQSFSYNADGSNLTFKAAALLTFSQQSQGLFVDSHYAYIAFNNASGTFWFLGFTKGFVAIDITHTSWFLINYYDKSYTYDTHGMDPRGINVPTSNRAIVVGVGGGATAGTEQYQVVDISNINNMTYCGGYPIASGVFGISSILDIYSNAYSYIITGESNDQFKIIRGGVGGGGYAASGSFVSGPFYIANPAAFNRFSATIIQPSQTTISLQVAVAPAVSGSCPSDPNLYTFVGPNADPSAYFVPTGSEITGPIPFTSADPYYQNPNNCFRYKVFFTTSNPLNTPSFNDITVNYSP